MKTGETHWLVTHVATIPANVITDVLMDVMDQLMLTAKTALLTRVVHHVCVTLTGMEKPASTTTKNATHAVVAATDRVTTSVQNVSITRNATAQVPAYVCQVFGNSGMIVTSARSMSPVMICVSIIPKMTMMIEHVPDPEEATVKHVF